MPTASIIVCVRGAVDCLAELLRYLGPDDGDELEVLIVDDANDACDRRRIEDLAAHYAVRLLRLETRQWYVRAANAGVAAAGGQFVILVNSDALLSRETAVALIAALRCHPHTIVGPVSNAAGYQSLPWIRDGAGNFAVCPLPNGASPRELEVRWREHAPDSKIPVGLLNGFCLAFSRNKFLELGGFNAQHFPYGYGEEYDLAVRWLRSGGQLVVAGNQYVYHLKTQSFEADLRVALIGQARQNLADLHGQDLIDRLRGITEASPQLAQLRTDMLAHYAEMRRCPRATLEPAE